MSPRTLASSVVCRTRAPTQKSQRVTNRATIAPAASTAASLSQIPPLARGFGAAMTSLSATRLSAAGLSAAGLMSDPGCASTMPFRSLSTDHPCALHAGGIEEIDGVVALAAIGIIRRRDRRPSLRPLEEGAEIVDVAAPRQSRVAPFDFARRRDYIIAARPPKQSYGGVSVGRIRIMSPGIIMSPELLQRAPLVS